MPSTPQHHIQQDGHAQQLTLHPATVEATQALGAELGRQLHAGDLVILTGELGAGKTTLTQGLGAGLQVREGVISPTFVLSRIHPSMVGGPNLVHVDAYRLSDPSEVDTLDLEATAPEAVTVVEWGAGKVEHLNNSRLVLTLARAALPTDTTTASWEFDDEGSDEPRTLTLSATGPDWEPARWKQLRAALEATLKSFSNPEGQP